MRCEVRVQPPLISNSRMPSAPPEDLFSNRPGTPPPSYQEACQLDLADDVFFPDPVPCLSKRNSGQRYSVSGEVNNNEQFNESPRSVRAKRSPRSHHRSSREETDGRRESRSSQTPNDRVPCPAPRQRTSSNLASPHLYDDSYMAALADVEAGLIPGLSCRDVYNALYKWYAERPCFIRDRTNFRYTVTKVQAFCIWTYQLQTVTERRTITRKQRPYSGPVEIQRRTDSPTQLSEWDYEIPMPSRLCARKIELPDSVSIAACNSCSGEGALRCSRCRGEGKQSCERCSGSGHIQVSESGRKHHHSPHSRKDDYYHVRNETCFECHGSTITRCCMCQGSALQTCKSCRGYRKIEKYSQLHVEWKGESSSYTSDKSSVSPYFVKQHCKNIIAYENSSETGGVPPINSQDCIHRGVIHASRKYTDLHGPAGSTPEVIRQQKHEVAITPVYKAICHRGSKEKVYWLVGTNLVVYKKWFSDNPCFIM